MSEGLQPYQVLYAGPRARFQAAGEGRFFELPREGTYGAGEKPDPDRPDVRRVLDACAAVNYRVDLREGWCMIIQATMVRDWWHVSFDQAGRFFEASGSRFGYVTNDIEFFLAHLKAPSMDAEYAPGAEASALLSGPH